VKDLTLTDQPDGSSILSVELTEEELNIFVGIGIRTALKEGLKKYEEELKEDE
jgi:hypothetical protein